MSFPLDLSPVGGQPEKQFLFGNNSLVIVQVFSQPPRRAEAVAVRGGPSVVQAYDGEKVNYLAEYFNRLYFVVPERRKGIDDWFLREYASQEFGYFLDGLKMKILAVDGNYAISAIEY